MAEKNRIQGMVRSIDQYRNGQPKAVAAGSHAQILYALEDSRHDLIVLWDFAVAAGGRNDALTAENAALISALQAALVAMKLASALPGVADEYDFGDAIATVEAALSSSGGEP